MWAPLVGGVLCVAFCWCHYSSAGVTILFWPYRPESKLFDGFLSTECWHDAHLSSPKRLCRL